MGNINIKKPARELHIFATAFMTHFEKMVQGDVQRLCKQESAGTTLEAAEKQRIPINQKLNN